MEKKYFESGIYMTEELYRAIIDYTKKRAHRIIFNIEFDFLDIVHNIIVDVNFSADNWRHLCDKYLYAHLSYVRDSPLSLSQIHERRMVEELWNCKSCQKDLPKSKFQLSWQLCNKCYRIKHKDRINANQRRWRINNPEKAKKNNIYYHSKRRIENQVYMKQYRQENRERIACKEKEYRELNKEKIREKRRSYYLKNKK